jgi:hypothetical protein
MIDGFGRGCADSRADVLRFLMMRLLHGIERRHVVLLLRMLLDSLMLELVRVHCLRLVHPLLLRRMVQWHW